MFEHVGIGHYKEYFTKMKKLLKPDGIFLLHSIGRSNTPSSTNPFIRKYIFPGGYISALSEVIPVIEKSRLIITDIEILRLHTMLIRSRHGVRHSWQDGMKPGHFMMNISAVCGSFISLFPKAHSAGRA